MRSPRWMPFILRQQQHLPRPWFQRALLRECDYAVTAHAPSEALAAQRVDTLQVLASNRRASRKRNRSRTPPVQEIGLAAAHNSRRKARVDEGWVTHHQMSSEKLLFTVCSTHANEALRDVFVHLLPKYNSRLRTIWIIGSILGEHRAHADRKEQLSWTGRFGSSP
jgi:hypothetical protein